MRNTCFLVVLLLLGFSISSPAQIDLYLIKKPKIDSLKKGLVRLPFDYKKLEWVSERGACFELADGRRGLSTLEGEISIPAQYAEFYTEPHGHFFVQDFDTKKYGVINAAGQIVIPLNYKWVQDLSDYYGEYAPLIQCQTDANWALFDLTGKRLTEHTYQRFVWQPVAPEVVFARHQDGTWETLHLDGQPFGEGPYASLEMYANGIAVSKKGQGCGFLRYDGTLLTQLIYRDSYGFVDAEEAAEKAREIGLPEHLTLVGDAKRAEGNYERVWIDSEGGEHLISK